MSVRVVVSGATGRMGRAITDLAAGAEDVRLVGGLNRGSGVDGAGELIREADVVIDVSAPEFLETILDAQGEALAGRSLVVGTTGLGQALHQRLDLLAERCAVLVAANFSIGVNLLLALVEEAARRLPADRYDVEIVEVHHRGKADAPSGTALALGRAVADGRGVELESLRRDGRRGRTGERPVGEVAFHAVRGGGAAGDHRVHFLGSRERIELAHGAADRSLFAEGALEAARWIAGRPVGRYTMRQVLGLD